MPDAVEVEIVNGARVDAMWRGVVDDLEHVDRAMAKGLAVALDAAQATAPRATGLLAASHTLGPGAGPNRLEMANTARYARMVHNGTRYLRARPWLVDAITSTEPRWQAAMTAAVQADLDTRARAT